MGLYKIDNVSKEEWERRMMRKHSIQRWIITLLEIFFMVGVVLALIWIANQMHP